MSYNSIEGVHYILDRYAFLNAIMEDGGNKERVTPDSSQNDFNKVLRLARAMHHPDRQARAGKKQQMEAERMSKLIDDCDKFLTNPEIKPLYDDKLTSFRKNKPHMVSTDGVPIISLDESTMDIDSLLSEEIKDTTEFEALVQTHLQYDENESEQ
ncbi:MAG TPA: hypothetical protein VIF12_04875, partial [Micavibrio sp.]